MNVLDTQCRTNREHIIQRTSDLASDGKPDTKLFHIWQTHDIDDHLAIWFSSVRLQSENSYQ